MAMGEKGEGRRGVYPFRCVFSRKESSFSGDEERLSGIGSCKRRVLLIVLMSFVWCGPV